MYWLSLAPLLLVFAGATAHAQSGTEVIRQQASSPLATSPTFPARKDLVYRVAWAVNTGPAQPDSVVPGFRSAANFVYVSDANGVPRANLRLAIVVWGTATHSLLRNEAYRAAKGADNARDPRRTGLHHLPLSR